MAKKLVLEVPDGFNVAPADILMMLAAGLYERAELSLGHAAALAGLDKRTFMERLGKYGVSVFNHSVDDFLRDVKNA